MGRGWGLKLLALILTSSASGFAHDPSSSLGVTAILHIEPNDRPVVGGFVKLWLNVIDAGDLEVTPRNCQCRITVLTSPNSPGKKPIIEVIPPERALRLETGLRFASAGTHLLLLDAKPRGGSPLSPFKLLFFIEVQAAR